MARVTDIGGIMIQAKDATAWWIGATGTRHVVPSTAPFMANTRRVVGFSQSPV